jgi:membrane protease YdiL (CAAX protease family)
MEQSRFGGKRLRFEPEGPDFPYYTRSPVTISPGAWLLAIAGTAAGFAALVTPMPFTDDIFTGWARVAAFVLLPLLGLILAAPQHWKALFRPVGLREVKLMFGFAFLNILISMAIGVLVSTFGTTASNTAIANTANLDGGALAGFFAKVAPQLLGEELITMIPFLAILAIATSVTGLSRNKAVLAAWLLSALIFGMLHLPTYDWNWVQCIVVIGSARLILTWAYIYTKNLWVSTGAHIINDWLIMGTTVILTPLAA